MFKFRLRVKVIPLGLGAIFGVFSLGFGNGVLRWGYGAADSGAAGVFGGTEGDSLATMQLNPAAMTGLESSE